MRIASSHVFNQLLMFMLQEVILLPCTLPFLQQAAPVIPSLLDLAEVTSRIMWTAIQSVLTLLLRTLTQWIPLALHSV